VRDRIRPRVNHPEDYEELEQEPHGASRMPFVGLAESTALSALPFAARRTELTRATEEPTMTVGCPLSGYPLHR
jgi:hypothetical protein